MINNKEAFIDSLNYTNNWDSIQKEILRHNDVQENDNHLGRHQTEINQKFVEIKKKLAEEDLLYEMPYLDRFFYNFLIVYFN